MLDVILSQVATGLVLDGLYVLIAIGLSIIFGLLGIVNFAHGNFFALGAYFALTLYQYFGWPAVILAPLLVGAVHGLAGSGALTALVLTTLPTAAARLTYMALFGLGSTLGMAALSGLLGWPLARMGNHHAVARDAPQSETLPET